MKIMVIDNDKHSLMMFKEVLELNGHECIGYDDSQKGLAEYSKEKFDMVITDHERPRLTGLEFTKNLKQSDPDVKVILCSSMVDDRLKGLAK